MLVSHGHSLGAVGEYTFLQFMVFARAIERQEAARRAKYMTDVSLVLAGLLTKDGHKDVKEQLSDLGGIYSEGENGNGKQPVKHARR